HRSGGSALQPSMSIYSFTRNSRFAPRYRVENDQVTLVFEMRLLVRDSSIPIPRYDGEIAISVEGPIQAEEPKEYRISQIKLIRASKPPVEDKGGPGKRGPRGS
ncbi:MAG: hypothetical protein SNJ75_19160, partial [Gemmataceae bacterium]